MLEGKEVDYKFDKDAGELFVDVTAKGTVEVGFNYVKDLNGFAKFKLLNSVETNIFDIAEKICAKTKTPYDDAAVKGLKQLLGISEAVAEAPVVEAPVAEAPVAEAPQA